MFSFDNSYYEGALSNTLYIYSSVYLFLIKHSKRFELFTEINTY